MYWKNYTPTKTNIQICIFFFLQNWRHRLQGVLQLEQALRSSENLASVQPCLDSLLRTLLSSECKTEVAEEKRKLLINLITRLPLDNLEDRTIQIMSGLCRQGGAGANRVCKALMQRLPPAAIILKLISQEFLHAKSSRVSNLSLTSCACIPAYVYLVFLSFGQTMTKKKKTSYRPRLVTYKYIFIPKHA